VLFFVDSCRVRASRNFQPPRSKGQARFREEVDARFDGIDTRLDRLDHDVVLLKDAVVANTREIKTMAGR